jgi:hypothetical protein
LVQLESGGHSEGHIGLQNSNEVFYTCGIPERDVRRHGKLSNEKALKQNVAAQIKDPKSDKIIGTVDVIGGPWQNAVYKATKNVDRSGIPQKAAKPALAPALAPAPAFSS